MIGRKTETNGPTKRHFAEWRILSGSRTSVDAFIVPSIAKNSTVLEVAMGHGRWTPFLAQRARRYAGIDLSPSCINFCRKRFAHLTNVDFYLTDGRKLSLIRKWFGPICLVIRLVCSHRT